jgi:hypothetical protein
VRTGGDITVSGLARAARVDRTFLYRHRPPAGHPGTSPQSTLADSWRQQPNSPAYCTELTLDELPAALAAADRAKDARIRDSLPERFAALGANPTVDDVVGMNRAAHR